MRNEEKWTPTKFIYNKKNKLVANPEYVSAGSLFIADLAAAELQKNINLYAKGSLLDLGCGTAPLYACYKDKVSEVTCIDWDNCFHDISYIDVSMDLNNPINIDKKFDTIILSDVLEHIYEPKKLIQNCYDLLNEDGVIIITTPYSYWEHEQPHDYYRYTQYFYSKFAEELGFKVEKIEPIGRTNYNLIRDVIEKTNQKSRLKSKLTMFLIKFALKKVNLSQPLAYSVVLKK